MPWSRRSGPGGDTSVTNKEIGVRFGGLSYSAVAKVCKRLGEEVEKNLKLRRIVSSTDSGLSNVKC